MDIEKIPQRHLSESEKLFYELNLEKLRVEREKGRLILDKGLLLFFAFFFFAVVLYLNKTITQIVFSLLILAGIIVLLIAVMPYAKIAKAQEDAINKAIESITGKKHENKTKE